MCRTSQYIWHREAHAKIAAKCVGAAVLEDDCAVRFAAGTYIRNMTRMYIDSVTTNAWHWHCIRAKSEGLLI